MGYELSKFGDGSTAGSGNVVSTVNNHYGPRNTGKTVGTIKTEGVMNELSMDIDGDMVGNEAFALDAPKLPAGAVVKAVYVEVTEAFVLGGTSPVIEVGTEGSEATNGVTITEAQAEAVATYDVTSALAGTWASPLAAETTVGIDLAGTSPTVTSAGKMRVVVQYARV
jgi:hypothetical protein